MKIRIGRFRANHRGCTNHFRAIPLGYPAQLENSSMGWLCLALDCSSAARCSSPLLRGCNGNTGWCGMAKADNPRKWKNPIILSYPLYRHPPLCTYNNKYNKVNYLAPTRSYKSCALWDQCEAQAKCKVKNRGQISMANKCFLFACYLCTYPFS